MSDDTLDPGAPSEAEWLPLRASLRDVAVPAEAREQALAAALAAFDELQGAPLAAAAAAPAAPPVSLAAHRERRYRWLAGAAAAVAVLAVGGVVLRSLDTRSDDGSNVAVATEASASSNAATQSDAAPAGSDVVVPEAKQAEATATGVLTATADTLAPAPAETMTGVGVTSPVPAPANAPVSTIGSIDGAAEYGTAPTIDSPQALAAFAADLTATSATTRSIPAAACLPSDVEVLGTVVYRQQQAIVVRSADGAISALDSFSCAVIVTVQP